jgi:hypothetical protein
VTREMALCACAVVASASTAAFAASDCESGSAPVQHVNRRGEVVKGKDRVYFQSEPRPCPDTGPCPWRLKAYVVAADRVDESAVSGEFSCVTYTRYALVATPVYEEVGHTTGWVPSADICLHPPLRKKRSDPAPALDAPGRQECEAYTSTLEDEAELYGGVFKSPTATLTVTDASSSEMTYRLDVNAGACRLQMSGTGYVHRPAVVNFSARDKPADWGPCQPTGTFDDRGVTLTYYRCEKPGCENLPDDTLAWQR